jgi:hypothetical protein
METSNEAVDQIPAELIAIEQWDCAYHVQSSHEGIEITAYILQQVRRRKLIADRFEKHRVRRAIGS